MTNKKYEFNQKEILELEIVRLKRNIRKINEEYGYIKGLIYDYIMRTTNLKLHKLVMEVDDRLIEEYFEAFTSIYSEDFFRVLDMDGIDTHQIGNTSSMRFTSGHFTESIMELEGYFDINNPIGFFALLDEIHSDCLHTGDVHDFINNNNTRVKTVEEILELSNRPVEELVGDLQEINEVLEYEYFEDEYLHEVINDEIVALKNVWDIIDGFLNNQVEIFYDFIGLEV